MTPQQSAVHEVLVKFPKHPTLTLAKKLFKEHPLLFTNLEGARSAVRLARGNIGEHGRKRTKNKTHYRKPQQPGDPWRFLPDALPNSKHGVWGPVQISEPTRTLILSDIHFPYHDKRSLRVALNYGIEQKATHIILNGDIADFFAISRWEPDPEERNLGREIAMVREFLVGLRKVFPKARIIYKLGNHEERWEKYLRLKAPELLGIADFKFEQIMHLADLKIEYVDEQRPIRLGRLNVLHGHEYRGISSPVNPARGYYLKAKVHTIAGHLHRTSQHSENDLEREVTSTWSTGCLCDLSPAYDRLTKWNVGFAFVTTDKDGAFEVENLRIINGKIYR